VDKNPRPEDAKSDLFPHVRPPRESKSPAAGPHGGGDEVMLEHLFLANPRQTA